MKSTDLRTSVVGGGTCSDQIRVFSELRRIYVAAVAGPRGAGARSGARPLPAVAGIRGLPQDAW